MLFSPIDYTHFNHFYFCTFPLRMHTVYVKAIKGCKKSEISLVPTSSTTDSKWPSLAQCVSDFLPRPVKAAALHAGVTPVTYFTLGYILSGHLDEEITFSQCMNTTALPARQEHVFV